MTEKEADICLKSEHANLFATTIHKKTNYAAVVKHPRKPKQFAIEVGAYDKSDYYIDKFILSSRYDSLYSLGFKETFVEKLSKLDKASDAKSFYKQMKKSDLFTSAELEGIKFKSQDLLLVNKSAIPEFGFSSRINELIKNEDIIPISSKKITLSYNQLDEKRTQKEVFDRIEGGISISSDWVSFYSGTLGGVLKLKGKKEYYGITNSHVLFRDKGFSKVVSPGKGNMSKHRTTIGEIHENFEILDQYADVGLIKLHPDIKIGDFIKNNYFSLNGMQKGTLGEKVKKYGISTGFKEGIILSKNATIHAKFRQKDLFFKKQIMTTKLNEPGDSGSLLVSENGAAVGLIFAESGDQINSFSTHLDCIFEHPKFQKQNIIFESFINFKS